MSRSRTESARERLVHHVQNLEALEERKQAAADSLKDAFADAKADGFDPGTLKAVLRLRKMTPEERKEKRALEAIYLASLGMLEGDPLTDEARRRLDGRDTPPAKPAEPPSDPAAAPPAPTPAPQRPLVLKDPEEARQEGGEAAAAGKRIYDNPYPAGDPCRAAWDEGWCAQRRSHGMDPPSAYQRRTKKEGEDKDAGAGDGQDKDAA